MVWQCYRYFSYDWIHLFYIEPKFLFKYYGFDWVHPLPGKGMYYVFAWLMFNSALVAIGWKYRFAIINVFLTFTYIFLLDEARYLNHFYLVLLIAFLMCFISAENSYSVDAKQKKLNNSIPYWHLFILLLMMEIMLVYAGVVKIQTDWLNGLPLSLWLSTRTDTPIIGPYLDKNWVHLSASYFAIAIHLLGAPLLLFKKTRAFAFGFYTVFHGLNSILFNIGIFPILTIAGTTLFLSTSWPRRFFNSKSFIPKTYTNSSGFKVIATLLGLFFILQILLPLRHYIYPGNVLWTDEGHKFSWRMKLREKNGTAAFYIRDPQTGQQWNVNPKSYLLPRQIDKVTTRPDLALQFAHFLAKQWQQNHSVENPDVRAWLAVSLNGRPTAQLIKTSVNLAVVKSSLLPADWIYISEHEKPIENQ
jgi:hypothetical protein